MIKIILGIVCFFAVGSLYLAIHMRSYYKNKLEDMNNGYKDKE